VPRIKAATVAEHRSMQRAALLDAARDLLALGGISAVTFSAMAERAGLARSSVYEYFKTKGDVVEALAVEDFPAAVNDIRGVMLAQPTPERQIAAYVRRQLELVSQPGHRNLLALSALELDGTARDRIRSAHGLLVDLVVGALRRLGHADARATAAALQGAIDGAAKRIDAGADANATIEATLTLILFGVRGARRRLSA
jgi:AcrR family transcriptional regulator